MRSLLVLNTPWQGAGNAADWTLTGADERALRECLSRLDAFATPDPRDRWTAAIVLMPIDRPPQATPRELIAGSCEARAWTIAGALRLADLLPETLGELADELRQAFFGRAQGWLGDADTLPARPTDGARDVDAGQEAMLVRDMPTATGRKPGRLDGQVTIKPGFDDLPGGFDVFAG
jgi:hypothetical protein